MQMDLNIALRLCVEQNSQSGHSLTRYHLLPLQLTLTLILHSGDRLKSNGVSQRQTLALVTEAY